MFPSSRRIIQECTFPVTNRKWALSAAGETQAMQTSSGKWVIGGILGLGLAAACLAVFVRHQQGRRVLELWGAADAILIRDAPHVELWRLEPVPTPVAEPPGGGEAALVRFGPRTWRLAERRDVTAAPGLLHVRAALLADDSFVWQEAATSTEVAPSWALVFRGAGRDLMLALDLESQQLGTADQRPPLCFAPIAAFLRRWLEQQATSQREESSP